ncbi:hypothetical protein HY732_04200 [Candidatus Uhrbacteria bacterium]|nr:hypothetical protein [Candidatus Uhrbacteria bacterium]
MNEPNPRRPAADDGSAHEYLKQELNDMSMALARFRHYLADHNFSFDKNATPHDREHELSMIADELERIAIRVDEFELSGAIEKKLRTLICEELDFASDMLHDVADTGMNIDLDQEMFIVCIERIAPATEEAEIVLHVLQAAHGTYIRDESAYLHADGRCGYTPKHFFSIEPLIGALSSALIAIDDCTIGENFDTFNPEKKTDLIRIGKHIKGALETIMKTLAETKGDPIEKSFRLVAVKLASALAIMREELSLSQDIFYSRVIAQTMNTEISGGFCLERIKQNVLTEDVSAIDALEDALAIMQMVHQITVQ